MMGLVGGPLLVGVNNVSKNRATRTNCGKFVERNFERGMSIMAPYFHQSRTTTKPTCVLSLVEFLT